MAGTAPAEQLPSERQLKKLIKVYSKALRRHPNNLDLRTKLAEVLRLLGRMEEAIALYSSVAWAHGVAGNLGQAITLCKIILQLSPEHSDTQQMLAKLYASKRIREAKQSIPVVRSIDGRWVADPRGTQVSAVEATTPPSAEPRMGLCSPPSLPPDNEDEEDDGEELTKDESPSNPDLVARRIDSTRRPTSKELPAARRVAPPPEPLEEAAPGSRAASDPRHKIRSPFTVAPTMLKDDDDPIVVRTDEEGQLVVDRSGPIDSTAAQGAFPTMQLPPTRLEKVGEQVPPPAPALPGRPPEVSIEEPTQLEDVVDQEEPTQLEAADPGTAAPAPARETRDDKRPTLDRRIGDAQSVESAIEDVVAPRVSAVPAGQRLSTGELSGVALGESGSGQGQQEDSVAPVVDGRPPADVVEAAPAVAGRSTSRLSPTDMMERLSERMPKAHSGQFNHDEVESALQGLGSRAGDPLPPRPDEVEPLRPGESGVEVVRDERAAGESQPPLAPRQTSPGFLSGADRQESARDPLRFIRTTRRYATIDEEPGAVGGGDTLADQIDPSLVSAVVRMDGMSKAADHQSPTKGYAAIQKEVCQAGNEQEDGEPDAEEAAEAERSLLDTIRELPDEVDPGTGVSLPKVPYPLFSDLDTPAFLAMVEKLERRVCPAGTLLFQEGDPGDSLFLISSGSLEVLKADDRGCLIELARLGPGSFFGEFGLLTDRHRHASVRTVDEAELLELRRDVLIELIREHPSISWTLRVFYQQRLMAMVLATSPLFQAVTPEERKEVLSRFAIKRIIEGELIIEEGKPGTGFYVILVGEVSVTCTSDDGAQIPLGILSEGDYFGEISLLTGTAAEASVRANAITEVLTLSAGDFYDLASAHPEIWAEVQEEAERRQRETAQRLAEQARRVKAAGPLCLI